MKIGLLFAGQGAQYTGMGKELCESSKAAANVFEAAGDEVKSWCFEGTKEMLRQTYITQPSIYTVSMAAYEAFKEAIGTLNVGETAALDIVGMAGFSLGEYTALTAGGAICDFKEGLEIVRNRGTWMNEAGLDEAGEAKGGMVAAFGDREQILKCVASAREGSILEGVNFNSPIQTVVAGDKEALARFRMVAKNAGMKAVPLSVGTAFHCEMMKPAVEPLHRLLLNSKLTAPKTKLYSNVTGRDIMEGIEGDAGLWIAGMMAKQAQSPVYWQEIVENMIADGIQVMIEIGPGSTLTGLVKKIDHKMITLNISDAETLESTMAKLGELSKREKAGHGLAEEEGEEAC